MSLQVMRDFPRRRLVGATYTSLRVEEEEKIYCLRNEAASLNFSWNEKTIRNKPKQIYSNGGESPEISLVKKELKIGPGGGER